MVRAEQSSAAPHAVAMETLGGFQNLPAMGIDRQLPDDRYFGGMIANSARRL